MCVCSVRHLKVCSGYVRCGRQFGRLARYLGALSKVHDTTLAGCMNESQESVSRLIKKKTKKIVRFASDAFASMDVPNRYSLVSTSLLIPLKRCCLYCQSVVSRDCFKLPINQAHFTKTDTHAHTVHSQSLFIVAHR